MPPPVSPKASWEGRGAAMEARAPVAHASGLEILMGAKFLSWFGAVAGFFAVVFFLKYSIDRGLFPPGVRATMGFVFGASLLVGGMFAARRNYGITAHALCACGILSLYGVTFACRMLYHFEFFGLVPTFVVMSLVTVVAFVISVRLDGKFVAVLGLFGGFMTPLLLETETGNALGLFGYIALLDIGLCAVALWQRWNFLVPLGILGTVLMQMVWAHGGCYLVDEIVVCLVFDGLFLLSYGVARFMRRETVVHSRGVAALVLVSLGLAQSLWWDALPEWEWWDKGVSSGLWQVLVFLILADACVLVVAAFDRCARDAVRLPALVGAGMFVVLGSWMGSRVPVEIPLVGCFAFALFHTAFPLALARVRAPVRAVAPEVLASVCAVFALLLVPAFLFFGVVSEWPVLLAVLLLAAVFGQWWWHRRCEARGVASECDLVQAVMASVPPFVLLAMMLAHNALMPSLVLGATLLLVVLTLGFARVSRSECLPVCALAGVVAVGYAGFFPGRSIGIPWVVGFCALFTAFPFVFWRAFSAARGAWFASAMSGVALFPLLHGVVRFHFPDNDVMGLVPAVLAAVALVCLVAVLQFESQENPRRMGRVALFGGVALLFVTLIFPVQLNRQWLTIAWALEGAALLGLHLRVPHRALPWVGVGLLGVVFVRLAFHPVVFNYHVRGEIPFLNWYFYTYGIAAACLFGGAWLLREGRRNRLTAIAARVLPGLGTALLFLLLNIEIADCFAEPGERAFTLAFSGNFARSMSYTIAWAFFALTLLVAGIWQRSRVVRYAALGLLAVVAFKLVVHDLANLRALYRAAAFLAVAAIMGFASFLYQKYLALRRR